jgi:glutamate-5-semialdehyde dehydrogenase
MRIKNIAVSAQKASIRLAAAEAGLKDRALHQIADSLENKKDRIVAANEVDLERSAKEKLALPLLKRLKFDAAKIDDVIEGIHSLIELPDPVGQTLAATEMDRGLELYKVSCPIGVVGVIFESRPDALVQISTLALKSGNSVLLKGGSEARETNKILAEIISAATEEAGIPSGWLQLLETRTDVNEMLKLDDFIDLIIPRGSNDFVRYIMDNSRIPVLGHADGICHCYVHRDAGLEMAVKVAVDSKIQYVAACNAAETLLVDREIAGTFLPLISEAFKQKQVEILGCETTRKIIGAAPASDGDWGTEYLDYKISVKVVQNLDVAIEHINTYGSGHTDTIITKDQEAAKKFMSLVDSGNVFWNCSTRFSDGFRYGLGAEVGISTNKIHARGPVGLEGLLIYKYKLAGSGQIVEDYANRIKKFTHRTI